MMGVSGNRSRRSIHCLTLVVVVFGTGHQRHKFPGQYPQCQCEKQPEEGCGFLAPLEGLVNRPGYVQGLQQPPCILLDYWTTNQVPTFSIILTVHNQSRLIQHHLRALLDYTTGSWELLVVFDFCTDNSQDLALSLLRSSKHPDTLTHVLLIEQATPVWETTANNIGMRASHPNATLFVLLQDDMEMTLYGWNSLLAVPTRLYSDVVAVSGRCAHMAYSMKESELPEMVGRCQGVELDRPLNVSRETMCTFHVRDTVNRGPLLLVADRTRLLGYFDELNFYLGDDDHDFMARAWFQFRWVCGWIPLDFSSRLEDGMTRRKRNYTLEELTYLEARKGRIQGGFRPPMSTSDHNENREISPVHNCLNQDYWWLKSSS